MSESSVKKSPSYRRFTSADVAAAHGLSLAVRWPHRADDWRFMSEAGTGFVAEDNGAVIGTALCWKFGADRGTLGLVIVSPDEQGRGIGRRLMEQVLEELGNRVTFLHATVAGKPLYEKLGFVSCGGLVQHQGTLAEVAAVAPPPGEHLRAAKPEDIPQLIELASRASGFDRSATLPALLEFAQGVVLERDGEVLGFSLFRPFGRGYAIGPVVARQAGDDRRASALISYWLARHEGDFVRIDVPAEAGIHDWLDGLGMARVDAVEKMVRNASADLREAAPDATWRAYGIINQAMA